MTIKIKYENEADVPEVHKELYEKVGEEWVLTGVEDMKTVDDVNSVQTALRNERTAHKDTKVKLASFGDLDPEVTRTELAKIEEYKATAEATGTDEEKVERLVLARTNSKIAPLEREIGELKIKATEKDNTIVAFQTSDRQRKISDKLRGEAREAKVTDSAIEDVMNAGRNIFELDDDGHVVVAEGKAFPQGTLPSVWLSDMKEQRPHWWPQSTGAGAKGNGTGTVTNNPFTHENWNLTEQGKLVKADPTKAKQMADAAGIAIGGSKPAARSS